jgi:ethanolamine utilization protein EutN
LDLLLALVKGRATATAKHASLHGQKLLVCQPLEADGTGRADPILAVDQIGAGRGDRVMLSSDGQGVRDLLGDNTTPVRCFTLGIVDEAVKG